MAAWGAPRAPCAGGATEASAGFASSPADGRRPGARRPPAARRHGADTGSVLRPRGRGPAAPGRAGGRGHAGRERWERPRARGPGAPAPGPCLGWRADRGSTGTSADTGTGTGSNLFVCSSFFQTFLGDFKPQQLLLFGGFKMQLFVKM